MDLDRPLVIETMACLDTRYPQLLIGPIPISISPADEATFMILPPFPPAKKDNSLVNKLLKK